MDEPPDPSQTTGDMASHGIERVRRLLHAHHRGAMTISELRSALSMLHDEQPNLAAEIVQQIRDDVTPHVHRVADQLEAHFKQLAEQVVDIEVIRRSSPLRPSVRLILYGGYEYGSKWWLDGRKHRRATFQDFVACGAGKMPAAFVELDEAIDRTERCGRRHHGRFAILRLRHVARWLRTEIVTIHIVESLPHDGAAFYAAHPFGTEIETHATYEIAD